MATQDDPCPPSVEELDPGAFAVDRLVEVASRTWPGINQPGGVARISRVYFQEDDEGGNIDDPTGKTGQNVPTHVDVLYVVGRSKEKRVPIEYVTLAPQYERPSIGARSVGTGLRDRGLILGRCRRCGSLRKDCGSCDWRMEEQLGEEVSTVVHPTKSRRTKSKPLQHDMSNVNDVGDSSDSSDEQDDIALSNLISASRKRYRRHLRNRKLFQTLSTTAEGSLHAAQDGQSVQQTENSNRTMQQSALQIPQDRRDSSSDGDDEDLDELWSRSEHRYRRYAAKRTRWESRQRRRTVAQRDTHMSILETLGRATTTTTHTNAKPKHAISGKDDTDTESNKIPHETLNRMGKKLQRPERQTLSTGDCSDEGPSFEVTERSSPGHLEMQSDDSSINEVASYLSDKNDELYRSGRRDVEDASTERHINRDELTLSQFIQPEGRDAAEGLPADMVDRTRSIPFVGLAQFFNDTANFLENDAIPSFQLQLAEIQHRWRILHIQTQDETSDSSKEILESCAQLWSDATSQLVRDGTDQCRAALRLLGDRKLFKKHRNSLTPQQRKEIRGTASVETRDLRLDAIEELVDSIVLALRDLSAECEQHLSHQYHSDDDDDDRHWRSTGSDDNDSAGDYETQDLVPLSSIQEESRQTLDPCERQLGAFDPHQFATRKRKINNIFHVEQQHTKHRNHGSSNGGKGAKKRIARASFVVPDNSTNDRPLNTTALDATARDNPISAIQLGEPISNLQNTNNYDGTESKMPSFGTTEVNLGTPALSSRPLRRNTRPLKEFNTAEPAEPKATHTQRPRQKNRVPISQRMQEFLDKNKEWESGEYGYNTTTTLENLDARPEVKRSRQQRRNVPATRSRKSKNWIATDRHEHASSHESENRAGDDSDQESTSSEGNSELATTQYLIRRLHSPENLLAHVDQQSGAISNNSRSQHSQHQPNDLPESTCTIDRSPVANNGFDQETTTTDNIVNMLQRQGTVTILELISRRDPQFPAHVHLLVKLVQTLDDLETTFNRKSLVELLFLQVVDATYALLHPSGWALKIRNRLQILKSLEPIRDELAKVAFPTESASTCIVRHLESQKWRVSGDETSVFVSSLDPALWRDFVLSGDCSLQFEDLRFQLLGKNWARIEVNAAWKVLLFFAAPKSTSQVQSENRWHLIWKLFSSSALSTPIEEEVSLPPSVSQLTTVESDIRYLVRLLRTGNLGELPASDKLLATLIERTASLQVDASLGNDELRLQFSMFSDPEAMHKFPSRLWNDASALILSKNPTIESQRISIFDLDLEEPSSTGILEPHNVLYPSCGVMRGCVALLLEWSRCLSKKKVRRTRYLKQLKGLHEAVMRLDPTRQECLSSEQQEEDFFGRAFFEHPADGTDAKGWTSAMVKEFAAVINIINSLVTLSPLIRDDGNPTTNGITLETMQQMWDTMASDALRQHREMLLQQESTIHVVQGDEKVLAVLVVAKVMAMLGVMCLDLSPWNLGTRKMRKMASLGADEHSGMIDYYTFPVSCVLTCLDYLCQIAKLDGINPSLNRLAVQANSVFIPILSRCFHHQMTLPGDAADELSLSLMLCSLRAVTTFLAIRKKCREKAHEGGVVSEGALPAEADLAIGDTMDEDLYDLVDLGAPNTTDGTNRVTENKAWKILIQALARSKPSEQFNLSTSVRGQQDLSITARAKFLVKKHTNKICDCLVAIAALQDNETDIWDALRSLLQPELVAPEDAAFQSQISRRVVSQLCLVSSSNESCQRFISSHFQLFLSGVLESIVDPSRLEIYPSCHVSLLRNVGGDSAAREGIAILDVFNSVESPALDDEEYHAIAKKHKRRKILAESSWDMVYVLLDNLPANLQCLSGTLKAAATNENQEQYVSTLTAASLEKEASRCFRFIQGVVSALSSHDTAHFESFAMTIVCILSSHVLRLSQSMKYQDQTTLGNLDDNGLAYKRARTAALYSVFVELFIASTLWVIRKTPKQLTSGHTWKLVLNQLYEGLYYPVMQHRKIDLTPNFKKIIDNCNGDHSGWNLSVAAAAVGDLTHIQKCPAKHFDIFLVPLIRHCRQLLLSEFHHPNLLANIVESVLGTNSDTEVDLASLVGRSFALEPENNFQRRYGPLEDEIDHYLWSIEQGTKVFQHDELIPNAKLTEKSLEMLQSVIIPRVRNRSVSTDSRRKILRVTRYILLGRKQQSLSCTNNDNEATAVLEMLCSLVKAIRITMDQVLYAKRVDGDCVSEILQCTSGLAKLKVLEDSDEDSWLTWCIAKVSRLDRNRILTDLCKLEIQALYLYTFFQWTKSFAKLLITLPTSESQNGQPFPNSIRVLSRDCLDEINSVSLGEMLWNMRHPSAADTKLEKLKNMLNRMEKELSPPKSESGKVILNKYAKKTETEEVTKDDMEPWFPTNIVKRAAKEYLVVTVSLT